MRLLRVATCNLNQWAMNFDTNLRNVKESIARAKAVACRRRRPRRPRARAHRLRLRGPLPRAGHHRARVRPQTPASPLDGPTLEVAYSTSSDEARKSSLASRWRRRGRPHATAEARTRPESSGGRAGLPAVGGFELGWHVEPTEISRRPKR
ncbi:unnamed protein product [Urochloa humidicola]